MAWMTIFNKNIDINNTSISFIFNWLLKLCIININIFYSVVQLIIQNTIL